VTTLVLALTLVFTALWGLTPAGAATLVLGVALLALSLNRWSRRCWSRIKCGAIDHLLLGAASALGVLGLFSITGAPGVLAPMIAVTAVLTAAPGVASFVFGCRGRCCGDEMCGCHQVPRPPAPAMIHRRPRTQDGARDAGGVTPPAQPPPQTPAPGVHRHHD
jgi:hypothetical protein